VQINNASGVKGVTFDAKLNKWRSCIKINNKRLHLGYFEKIEDAIAVRKQAERTHYAAIQKVKEDKRAKQTKYFTTEERRLAKKMKYKKWSNRKPLDTLVNNARQRAKINGLPFDLDKTSIDVPEYCECCGDRMYLMGGRGTGRQAQNSVSFDRLDGPKGYSSSNVRFICWQCNRLKSNCDDPGRFFKIWMYMINNRVATRPFPSLGLGLGSDPQVPYRTFPKQLPKLGIVS